MLNSEDQLLWEKFTAVYELQNFIFYDDWDKENGRPVYIGERERRFCYFCGKGEGQTSFRNVSHLIPEFLGNTMILSLHECDGCNSEFSKYETALASYIGPARCFWGVHGKRGLPNHRDPKTDLRIDTAPNSVTITSHQDGDPEFEIDETSNSITGIFRKEGYIPVFAFKALVKIGICLLPSNEIANFSATIDWLKSNQKPEYSKWDFAIVPWAFDGTEILRPNVQLYNRKVIEPKENPFEKCVILRFGKTQYQYFIPFSRQDLLIASDLRFPWKVPLSPFILPDFPAAANKHLMQIEILNSWEKKVGEIQTVTMTSDEPLKRGWIGI